MYVRNRDVRELETMVGGYYTALELRGIVEDAPSMSVRHFGVWLRHTRNWSAAAGWAHAIVQNADDRDPLEVFFELRDDFLALVPTTIAIVSLEPHHQLQRKSATTGIDEGATRPDRIEVRRYVPTGLHHFRWHFGDQRQDDWMLMDGNGKYDISLAYAQQRAFDEFAIEKDSWSRS
jgi:hypothetical protein